MILSPVEQSIKRKIESIGTPLKDWNIKIYRGILTGYNEAFIIDRKKKDELISADPKSAEIIRPILRGRDIKRYGFDFADQYIIATFPSKNYNIDDYPAVKEYLLTLTNIPLSKHISINIGIKFRFGMTKDIPHIIFVIVFIRTIFLSRKSYGVKYLISPNLP